LGGAECLEPLRGKKKVEVGRDKYQKSEREIEDQKGLLNRNYVQVNLIMVISWGDKLFTNNHG
jgi:hypothetical protein